MHKTLNFEKDASGEFSLTEEVAEDFEADRIIVPCLDPRKVAAFESWRPTFFDQKYGCVQAELHAIVVDDGSFETIAYYDVVVPAGSDCVRLTTYRYEIVEGLITRAHEYKTQTLHVTEISHRHPKGWQLRLKRGAIK